MQEITNFVHDLFIMIVGVSFIEILMPEGNIARYVKYVISLSVLGTMLLPIVKFIA